MARLVLIRIQCLLFGGVLSLSACHSPSSGSGPVRGKVIGIKDGDTFEILIDRKPEVVRLAHIDCPERGQPFGKAAKQFASDLCFGRQVVVKEEDRRDRYGRMIATVSLPKGTVVNKELVRAGLAWHFTRYSSDTAYALLEQQARNAGVGLWSEVTAIPPWEWRSARLRK
jgi:micrococcal nuclease